MATDNLSVSPGQKSAEVHDTPHAHLLSPRGDCFTSLPPDYPPPWILPSRSDVSTALSAAPLLTSSEVNDQQTARSVRPGMAISVTVGDVKDQPNCPSVKSVVLLTTAVAGRLLFKAAAVTLYALTSLMLAAGCTLLVVGAMLYVDHSSLRFLMHVHCGVAVPPNFHALALSKSLAVSCMVAGAPLALLGFLGIGGLLLRNRLMLKTFAWLMALLLLAQFTASAALLFVGDSVRTRLRQALVRSLKENYEGFNSTNPISQAVDLTQLGLGCCGVQSAEDFRCSPWFAQRRLKNITVPWSCSPQRDQWPRALPVRSREQNPPIPPPGMVNPHAAGRPCLEVLQEKLERHCVMLLVGLLTITAVEMGALGSALVVAKRLRQLQSMHSARGCPVKGGVIYG